MLRSQNGSPAPSHMAPPESNTTGGSSDFLPSLKGTSVKYPLVTSAWNVHTGRQVAIKTIERHFKSKPVSEEETSCTAGTLPLRTEDVRGHSGGPGRRTALSGTLRRGLAGRKENQTSGGPQDPGEHARSTRNARCRHRGPRRRQAPAVRWQLWEKPRGKSQQRSAGTSHVPSPGGRGTESRCRPSPRAGEGSWEPGQPRRPGPGRPQRPR